MHLKDDRKGYDQILDNIPYSFEDRFSDFLSKKKCIIKDDHRSSKTAEVLFLTYYIFN